MTDNVQIAPIIVAVATLVVAATGLLGVVLAHFKLTKIGHDTNHNLEVSKQETANLRIALEAKMSESRERMEARIAAIEAGIQAAIKRGEESQ